MTIKAQADATFHIDARGVQSAGWADVSIIDRRATILIDEGLEKPRGIELTQTQTEELARWLNQRLAR